MFAITHSRHIHLPTGLQRLSRNTETHPFRSLFQNRHIRHNHRQRDFGTDSFSESPSWIKVSIAAVALFALVGANSLKMVEPGHVGVVVNLFGEKQGVQEKERGVGVQFIPFWKTMYKFPTFEQNHVWEKEKKFTFQTSEGLVVDAAMGVTYHLQPDKIHILFAKYRRGMDEITHVFLHNYIRDAINTCASKLKIEDLYGVAKEQFMLDIQKIVHDKLKEEGIVIGRIYLIGNLNLPSNVVAALNDKIAAIQQAQQRENDLRKEQANVDILRVKAQGDADILRVKAQGEADSLLITAKAQAEANQKISNSLTDKLLELERVKKWDGISPKVVGGSGTIPILGDLGITAKK